MVLHTFAYRASVSPGVDTELTVVQDDVLTRTGATRFMIPATLTRLYYAYAVGSQLVDVYFETPSLITRKHRARIIPRNRTSIPPSSGYYLYHFPRPPISLTPTEELSAKARTDGASASDVYVVAALGAETLTAPPGGEPVLVRTTSNTTLTPGQWTTVKITPDVQLEAGTYSIVKALAISNSVVAARFIIPGQVWRPGIPVIAGSETNALATYPLTYEDLPNYEYGRFSHLAIPEVQFLANAADTNQVVYLWLIKVG